MTEKRHTERRAAVLVAAAVISLTACPPPPPEPAAPRIDAFAAVGAPFASPALVPFVWTVHDINGDVLTCRLDGDGDGTWDHTVSPCPKSGSRAVSVGAGSHTAVFEVDDGSFAPAVSTTAIEVETGASETFDIVAIQTTSPDARVTQAIEDAVELWESAIVRGVPDSVVTVAAGGCGATSPEFDGTIDDIVINVAVTSVGWAAGEAAPCVLGADGLPRMSFVNIDTPAVDTYSSGGYLDDLVAHEMGHALGFTGERWWSFRHDGGGDPEERFSFSGPRAMAEWSRLGGSSAVPLSVGGDHWNERVLQGELMTCAVENNTDHPLSSITIAAMADIGYLVDLGAAQPYELPGELGFLTC